jgi:hypothetical protein
MKIERKLKYGSFGWDDETKKFTIEHRGQSIELNKIYAFAFLRFAFSIAQRNWFRKMAKPKIEMPETESICDKNIREGKFEQEQYELPNINGQEMSDDVKFFVKSLVKK